MMGSPPVFEGAVNAMLTCALPRVAVPIVGAPGVVAGVTLFESAESGPGPTPLSAFTLHVTAVPLVNPVTTIGELAPFSTVRARSNSAVRSEGA